MKSLPLVLWIALLLLPAAGCEKEPKRLDDYFVEFATVKKEAAGYRFQLDNGRLLIPRETDYTGNEGQRVILNYIPWQGDTVKINYISDIFTGVVQSDGFPGKYVNDPVKIQSVWVGGDYLNMIIEVEYHSKPHKVALFRDLSSPTVDLWFSHSREDDPPGYPQMMYASFLLSSLRTQNGVSIPFRVFIRTYEGQREMQFILHEN
ncbi:MAG: NigD-like C-terminal domain-containing protein [Proteiniphilum sp.]